MHIGVPREIKKDEYRVGLTPTSVRELVRHGHQVTVETDAGLVLGLLDSDYENAGARIAESVDEVFDCDMIVKVKEPQPEETDRLRSRQILFTYLHLAPNPELTKQLIERKCTAIAYETVTDSNGGLPLLAPMSEVAGRMSVQAGAHALEIAQGGRGSLLGGVPGTPPAKVTVLGGGVVGMNAARVALGMEADVTLLDINLRRLAELDLFFGPALNTVFSTVDAVHENVAISDLVIGAVLVPGERAPKLVSDKMVQDMYRGSVLVDVAIDQGGCFETSRPTTHSHPTYLIHDVVHYCVANIPGAVARTATFALNNATLPFTVSLANQGVEKALSKDPHLRNGLNVYEGTITHAAVAEAVGESHFPADQYFPTR
ncbi:MAG: alanine dehydrogenase [Gammaproteobacteria bacterium]|nr:alanine dehydrogenase [Gammaproteobacteria bacterium]